MSTPAYRLINPQANRSFVFKWEPFDLTTRWHYHPELELIYFIKGETSAVIGDGFNEFKEEDLVLLGSNFPHVLQESQVFRQQQPDIKPFGLIIQFTEDFLGEAFIQKPELRRVRQLFERAHRGIQFGPDVTNEVSRLLHEMPQLSDPLKLVRLLHLLTVLSETNSYEYLTNQDYYFDHSQDEEKMWQVNQYVYKHFREKITIADVAAVANMTETSFCRYFKSRTLKNFIRYLNEIRVAYACKCLQKSDYSVTDACFESGFNSLPYFTRQFKEIMGVSPQQFQKQKRKVLKAQ